MRGKKSIESGREKEITKRKKGPLEINPPGRRHNPPGRESMSVSAGAAKSEVSSRR